MTDITYNELGHNKFYIMQMLERNDKKKWAFLYKYG
ncbi:MAG: WGR domain-containing protein [Streptococcus sp.]|nr:WGR domain-containing protein [Streptococcus sp.]